MNERETQRTNIVMTSHREGGDDHARRLAGWVAELEADDLPAAVEERAGLVVADTVGAIVGGTTDHAVASLHDCWADLLENTSGGATVMGSDNVRTGRYRAAYLNGTAGTVLELDEGHRFAAGHPAIHVVPALLAESETMYADRDAFIVALVAGYEVAVRVAEAIQPLADGYHPHGVWGVVGGAAAVCRLRGHDAETTLEAMRMAANYAQHTRFDAASEGATVRNTYAGMSNLASLIAADQAGAGFTGLVDGIARHFAPSSTNGVDRERLDADIGVRWTIEEGYFKLHAACRYTHAALDAVLALRDDHDLGPEDVSTVTVETYPAAANLDTTVPRNVLQAKFSIPFAVATALVTGESGKEAFDDEAIDDEQLAVSERVSVTVNDAFATRAPEERGARITVETADDETISQAVRAARGGEHDPFDEHELREKFDALVASVLGEEQATELWHAARKPDAPRVICALTHV